MSDGLRKRQDLEEPEFRDDELKQIMIRVTYWLEETLEHEPQMPWKARVLLSKEGKVHSLGKIITFPSQHVAYNVFALKVTQETMCSVRFFPQ